MFWWLNVGFAVLALVATAAQPVALFGILLSVVGYLYWLLHYRQRPDAKSRKRDARLVEALIVTSSFAFWLPVMVFAAAPWLQFEKPIFYALAATIVAGMIGMTMYVFVRRISH